MVRCIGSRMSDDDSTADDQDVVVLRGPTDDGEGVSVLRARNGSVESAELRAVKQGASIEGAELIRLLPRQGSPVVWNVRVEYDGRASSQHAGPAKVSSRAYRRGWDAIFGEEVDGDERALN